MDNNMLDLKKLNGPKTFIKILLYLVYIAGGIFATLAFSNSLEGFYPESPIMSFLAHVGAWANLMSILLMPWAKDYWITGKTMMWVAIVGWVMEVGIMAFNVLAAFGSSWATWFLPLSPASPVFVVALWGVLWFLHPDHLARQEALDFVSEVQTDFQGKMRRAMKNKQIDDIMRQGAEEAARQYAERLLDVAIDESRANGTYNVARHSPTVFNAEASTTEDKRADPTKPR